MNKKGLNIILQACLHIFLGMLVFHVNAQNSSGVPTGDSKVAKDNFSMGNYKDALVDYLNLLKADSSNIDHRYHAGVCYLYLNIDKKQALKYLKSALDSRKYEPDINYDLGLAYMYNNKLDEAITYFTKYKNDPKAKHDQMLPAKRLIEMCNHAKEMIAHPVSVTFENMGPEINTAFADFSPLVPEDESFMVFTSRRDLNIGKTIDYDGYITADVYINNVKNGVFTKSKNMGNLINTEMVEEAVGLAHDGSILYVFCDNNIIIGDLTQSLRKGKSFAKSTLMSDNVNSQTFESGATIDPSHKFLIFSSDRTGTTGKQDLWISYALPNGDWTVAKNLGKVLNTEWDETHPYLSADGKTLYFSSTGHNSMGGFDIFYSKWNEAEKSWGKPINMGYPINTTEDNNSICLSSNPKYAYSAYIRPEGYGDLDIYRIGFADKKPLQTLVKGMIITNDSTNIIQYILNDTSNTPPPPTPVKGKKNTTPVTKPVIKIPDMKIEVIEKNKKTLIGTWRANKSTGKYAMNLPVGIPLVVKINIEGFEETTFDLLLQERDLYKTEINRNLFVKKISITQP